jgi:hypothetical protein
VAAAHWYRLAAAEGNTRAQINLGFLYEKGLGVERDPVEALRWYRRASGLVDDLVLDPGTVNPPAAIDAPQKQEALEDFNRQVTQLEKDTLRLNKQLEETQRQLDEAHRELEQKRVLEIQESKSSSEQLQQADARSSAKERELQALKSRIDQQQGQVGTLQSELDATLAQLAKARIALEQSQYEGQAQLSELEQTKAALAQYEQISAADKAEVARLERLWQQRESEIARQDTEMQRLQARIDQLDAEAESYRSRLAEQDSYKAAIEQGNLTGPSITMIDPQLTGTRSTPTVSLRSNLEQRQIIGQISAPAGLLSLTINDQSVSLNEQGVFRAQVPVGGSRTPVSVIAIDKQGKRASTDFVLQSLPETPAQKSVEMAGEVAIEIPDVNFGKYHALVIGIDDYQSLPRLQTAVNDANAVADILKNKYGFQVTKLLNASRYDILSALNTLREKLTSDDNLLIYYAGHGELERVNMRGHWLPADAEPDNTANWLSNVAVTDMLNIINAKQILVVADSCYSGALTRSALSQLKGGLTEKERLNWLKVMAKKRSRTVLTSGGLEPTLDEGGGGHSVFARALLDVLESNDRVLEGGQLYKEVSAQVAYAAARLRFNQVPEYAPVKYTGHEGGDFFLVPAL